MGKKEISSLNKLLHKFASRQVIEKLSSEVNSMLEVVKVGDALLLNSSNTNYSYGGLHRVFQKVFHKLDIQSARIGEVLILGFGTGSVATILQEELGIDCHITAVEKDPEVIRLGKEYFNTGRFSGLELFEADAADFMANADRTFGLIVVDVYVDFEAPASCEGDKFIADLEKCLDPGGMVLFNKLVYNHKAGEEAAALMKKFKKLPGKTRVIKVKENVVNRIIVYENSIQNPESSI